MVVGGHSLSLVRDDALHDDELKDGADDGANGLDDEGHARRELGVFCKRRDGGQRVWAL